jgi:hypothetical protein
VDHIIAFYVSLFIGKKISKNTHWEKSCKVVNSALFVQLRFLFSGWTYGRFNIFPFALVYSIVQPRVTNDTHKLMVLYYLT